MNRWTEQLKEHPIHETIRTLEEHVNKEFDDITEDELMERKRFMKALDLYKSVLKDVDPELLPFNQIDTLNTQLRSAQIFNQISSYAQNRNPAHLTAANDHLSTQLTPLCLIKSISNKNVEDSGETTQASFEYALRALIKKKDELSEAVDELKEDVGSSKEKTDELTSLIEQRKKDADALVSQWQQQFSEAQNNRLTKFQEWLDERDEKADLTLNEITKKYQEYVNTSEKDTTIELENLLVDSKSKHEAILSLYELTAGDSVGAGYLKNANEEKKQANIWRRMSIAFIVLTVIWLLVAYFMNGKNHMENIYPAAEIAKTTNVKDSSMANDEVVATSNSSKELYFDWYKLITTFSLTGVLLFGAAYSSQQSNKHRANEKRNMWFTLQVKAFDPFVSSLSSEEQQELKKHLSEKLFGNFDVTVDSDNKVIDEHAIGIVVKSITDILSKLPKT